MSSEDGLSTGPHFNNPRNRTVAHGLPRDAERHWGDLGNLRVVRGVAMYDRVDTVFSLRSVLGRAVTVHALRDVGGSVQPTGGSGARYGVGVIGFANPDTLARLGIRD